MLQGFLLPQHLGPAGEYCEKAIGRLKDGPLQYAETERPDAPPAASAGETLRARRDIALMLSATD